ncbi:TolC family protein [Dysgonomonas sp. ZJ709]|uniref:TolC family protein n=1 Tax=Dysgonomonas sp. ZJ709 TaxID=2709797 RepID=UPI0013ECCFFA|nr:TolC family protein [Dysgonomonas sp. ZJ709]
MKRNMFIIACVFAVPLVVSAQNTALTLEMCHQKSKENYPLIKRYELIEKSKNYNLENASKGYLPQVSLSAKASYQSEVTAVPISVPGVDIPRISKDQYLATLDVTQTIWDGGVIRSKKEVTKTSAQADQKQLDVDMYAINDRVNQLYFGVLLLDEKLKQNSLLQEELQRNYNLITSYIQNGVANQSDLDEIKIEQLKAIQNQGQLQLSRKSYMNMLAILLGESFGEGTALQKPSSNDLLIPSQIKRPELELFDTQLNNLESQKKMIKTTYMPKLGLFVTGGYGRPGLNMLEDEFSPYYIGGIRLSWNFGSLYTQKNDRRLIEISQNNVLAQRETFLFNTNIETTQENNEIKKNRDLLKYDDEIILLRSNVKKATEVKVANGISTITDLLRDVNAEDMAKQDRIQHETELLLSIYNLKFTTNN